MPLPHSEATTEAAEIMLWDERLDELDYYALLGVTESDSVGDYERAYHRFALRFHPDCHLEREAPIRDALTRIFQRGAEARRVLSDPQLRARYRALLREGAIRLSEETPVPSIDLSRDLPALHQTCRSAGAKLEAMTAFRAWQRGEFESARQRLVSALAFDGNANPSIANCLSAIDGVLLSGAHSER